MRWTWQRAAGLVVGLALVAAGCGDDDGKDNRIADQYEALTTGEQTHFDRMNQLDDLDAMHQECGRYAAEMDGRMSELGTSCRDRMSERDFGTWNGMAGGMRTRIEQHRLLCGGAADPGAARAEAARHHQEMGPLLDQMGTMMRGAGMMDGGGMMNGGGGMMNSR